MRKVELEENEYIVMAMFEAKTRQESAEQIAEILPFIEEDEELTELVRGTIDKMGQISDADYSALDLEPYKQEPEDEDED